MRGYTDTPITIKLTQSQREKLAELSAETGRSESDLIREAIMALLGVYYAERTEDALAEAVDEGLAGGKR